MKIQKKIKNIVKGNNPTTLLVFNLYLFITLLVGVFIASFDTAWIVVSLVMYFLMICCGVSITYHRALTHKALTMPKWLERIFSTFACMAGTGSPIMWVMTHRQHHRFADKVGDPHPPGAVYKTIFGVYPRVNGHIRDIVADKYYRIWHRNYFGILAVWAALLYLTFGFNALYFIVVVPVAASVFISNALNWFGHKESKISYRNYDLKDHSQNNWIMALLAFGEGWHNNHHRHPGSAKFGIDSKEIDISFIVIKILEAMNLANGIKYPNEQLKRI
jgi:fatty-acid desaturase